VLSTTNRYHKSRRVLGSEYRNAPPTITFSRLSTVSSTNAHQRNHLQEFATLLFAYRFNFDSPRSFVRNNVGNFFHTHYQFSFAIVFLLHRPVSASFIISTVDDGRPRVCSTSPSAVFIHSLCAISLSWENVAAAPVNSTCRIIYSRGDCLASSRIR